MDLPPPPFAVTAETHEDSASDIGTAIVCWTDGGTCSGCPMQWDIICKVVECPVDDVPRGTTTATAAEPKFTVLLPRTAAEVENTFIFNIPSIMRCTARVVGLTPGAIYTFAVVTTSSRNLQSGPSEMSTNLQVCAATKWEPAQVVNVRAVAVPIDGKLGGMLLEFCDGGDAPCGAAATSYKVTTTPPLKGNFKEVLHGSSTTIGDDGSFELKRGQFLRTTLIADRADGITYSFAVIAITATGVTSAVPSEASRTAPWSAAQEVERRTPAQVIGVSATMHKTEVGKLSLSWSQSVAESGAAASKYIVHLEPQMEASIGGVAIIDGCFEVDGEMTSSTLIIASDYADGTAICAIVTAVSEEGYKGDASEATESLAPWSAADEQQRRTPPQVIDIKAQTHKTEVGKLSLAWPKAVAECGAAAARYIVRLEPPMDATAGGVAIVDGCFEVNGERTSSAIFVASDYADGTPIRAVITAVSEEGYEGDASEATEPLAPWSEADEQQRRTPPQVVDIKAKTHKTEVGKISLAWPKAVAESGAAASRYIVRLHPPMVATAGGVAVVGGSFEIDRGRTATSFVVATADADGTGISISITAFSEEGYEGEASDATDFVVPWSVEEEHQRRTPAKVVGISVTNHLNEIGKLSISWTKSVAESGAATSQYIVSLEPRVEASINGVAIVGGCFDVQGTQTSATLVVKSADGTGLSVRVTAVSEEGYEGETSDATDPVAPWDVTQEQQRRTPRQVVDVCAMKHDSEIGKLSLSWTQSVAASGAAASKYIVRLTPPVAAVVMTASKDGDFIGEPPTGGRTAADDDYDEFELRLSSDDEDYDAAGGPGGAAGNSVPVSGMDKDLNALLRQLAGDEQVDSRSEAEVLRDRLIPYYNKHCPEKLEQLDKISSKYAHIPEKLFEFLEEKYGAPEFEPALLGEPAKKARKEPATMVSSLPAQFVTSPIVDGCFEVNGDAVSAMIVVSSADGTPISFSITAVSNEGFENEASEATKPLAPWSEEDAEKLRRTPSQVVGVWKDRSEIGKLSLSWSQSVSESGAPAVKYIVQLEPRVEASISGFAIADGYFEVIGGMTTTTLDVAEDGTPIRAIITAVSEEGYLGLASDWKEPPPPLPEPLPEVPMVPSRPRGTVGGGGQAAPDVPLRPRGPDPSRCVSLFALPLRASLFFACTCLHLRGTLTHPRTPLAFHSLLSAPVQKPRSANPRGGGGSELGGEKAFTRPRPSGARGDAQRRSPAPRDAPRDSPRDPPRGAPRGARRSEFAIAPVRGGDEFVVRSTKVANVVATKRSGQLGLITISWDKAATESGEAAVRYLLKMTPAVEGSYAAPLTRGDHFDDQYVEMEVARGALRRIKTKTERRAIKVGDTLFWRSTKKSGPHCNRWIVSTCTKSGNARHSKYFSLADGRQSAKLDVDPSCGEEFCRIRTNSPRAGTVAWSPPMVPIENGMLTINGSSTSATLALAHPDGTPISFTIKGVFNQPSPGGHPRKPYVGEASEPSTPVSGWSEDDERVYRTARVRNVVATKCDGGEFGNVMVAWDPLISASGEGPVKLSVHLSSPVGGTLAPPTSYSDAYVVAQLASGGLVRVKWKADRRGLKRGTPVLWKIKGRQDWIVSAVTKRGDTAFRKYFRLRDGSGSTLVDGESSNLHLFLTNCSIYISNHRTPSPFTRSSSRFVFSLTVGRT